MSKELKEIKFENQEIEDLLGALNLVINSLDANQIEVLERYIALFKKISD